jgi:hypothetical protein
MSERCVFFRSNYPTRKRNPKRGIDRIVWDKWGSVSWYRHETATIICSKWSIASCHNVFRSWECWTTRCKTESEIQLWFLHVTWFWTVFQTN